jgi:hypothetical protein
MLMQSGLTMELNITRAGRLSTAALDKPASRLFSQPTGPQPAKPAASNIATINGVRAKVVMTCSRDLVSTAARPSQHSATLAG